MMRNRDARQDGRPTTDHIKSQEAGPRRRPGPARKGSPTTREAPMSATQGRARRRDNAGCQRNRGLKARPTGEGGPR